MFISKYGKSYNLIFLFIYNSIFMFIYNVYNVNIVRLFLLMTAALKLTALALLRISVRVNKIINDDPGDYDYDTRRDTIGG